MEEGVVASPVEEGVAAATVEERRGWPLRDLGATGVRAWSRAGAVGGRVWDRDGRPRLEIGLGALGIFLCI